MSQKQMSLRQGVGVGLSLSLKARAPIEVDFLTMPIGQLAELLEEESSENPYLKKLQDPQKTGDLDAQIQEFQTRTLLSNLASGTEHSDFTMDSFAQEDQGEDLKLQIQTELARTTWDAKQQELIIELLDYLNEKGFMPETLRLAFLRSHPDLGRARLDLLLAKLQSLEPVGLGCLNFASYLKLCLLDDGGSGEEALALAEALSEFSLSFSADNLALARRKAGLDEAGFARAMEDIRFIMEDRFWPSYGWSFIKTASGPAPDFKVTHCKGEVRVESAWSLGQYEVLGSEAGEGLSKDEREAFGQRARQLYLRVKHQGRAEQLIQTLFEIQRDYFEHGNRGLKVCTRVSLLEAMRSKYSDWPLGRNSVYYLLQDKTVALYDEIDGVMTHLISCPVDDFFDSGVKNKSGELSSRSQVKALIRELIESEDPKEPLSDEKIRTTLQLWGIQISRKGVEKYRNAFDMGYPSMRERKQLAGG